jgi:DNA-binding transcriptional ArsR family regulator
MFIESEQSGMIEAGDRRRLDRLFEALAHPQRRVVLCALHEGDGAQKTIDELTAQVVSQTPSLTEPEARTALRHAHLPKLDDFGLLSYDSDGGLVRYEGEPAVEAILSTGLLDAPER